MKAQIHPKYNETQVTCACGNMFVVGSTLEKITLEVCSNCHPYFTGQVKFLDTKGRVDIFRAKQDAAGKKIITKTEKRAQKKAKKIKEQQARPDSLAQLRTEAGTKRKKSS